MTLKKEKTHMRSVGDSDDSKMSCNIYMTSLTTQVGTGSKVENVMWWWWHFLLLIKYEYDTAWKGRFLGFSFRS